MSNFNDFVIEKGILEKYVGTGGDVVIPDGVTAIGETAFWSCKELLTVTIPGSVRSIGYMAFDSCVNLQSVDISDGVTSIGSRAFSNCVNLKNVVIPDSVTSIGAEAFYRCLRLQSIVLPDSVTSLDGAFSCSGLQSIAIPAHVRSIGKCTFFHCGDLQSVVIPDGVTSIGVLALAECGSLKTIAIPDSVEKIAENAFRDSRVLKDVVASGKVFDLAWEALDRIQRLRVAYLCLRRGDLTEPVKQLAKKKSPEIIELIMKDDSVEAMDFYLSLYKRIDITKIDNYLDAAQDSFNVKAYLLDYKARHFSAEKVEKHYHGQIEKSLMIDNGVSSDGDSN